MILYTKIGKVKNIKYTILKMKLELKKTIIGK
jgi:hypothetical protein